MSPRRRFLSVLTASAAVLGLGFVVTVAARTLPGGGEEEPLFDLVFRTDIDLTPVFAWMLMILVVLVAVLVSLALRETRPRGERRRRGVLGAVVGLILFAVIVRWLRPAAEALLEEGAGAESTTDLLADGRAGTTGAWLFSILIAAVLAAALTRIGLSIKSVASPFRPQADTEAFPSPRPVEPVPVPRKLGDDPRSRILDAYADFETWLTALGRPRDDNETTARHARRAALELSLDATEVGDLVGHHSRARYGYDSPTEADALAAERTSARLRSGRSR